MTETNGLKWEDPPEARANGTSRGGYARTLKSLRERPGQWAVVATTDKIHLAVMKAQYLKNRYPDIEAVSRMVDGEARVYARATENGGQAT